MRNDEIAQSQCYCRERGNFSDHPVVGASPCSAGNVGSIPGQWANIPHAFCPKNQNITEVVSWQIQQRL